MNRQPGARWDSPRANSGGGTPLYDYEEARPHTSLLSFLAGVENSYGNHPGLRIYSAGLGNHSGAAEILAFAQRNIM